MKLRHLVFPILSILFIILVVLFPQQSLVSARKGLNLWFTVIIPSLLPFFIGSSIMIQLGIVDFISTLLEPIMGPLFNCPGSSAYVFAMSITSGYPMGAKLTSQLKQDDKITQVQAQRILAFSNTSGPLFMIGAVAIGMLGNPKLGTIIALSHYLAAIATGVLFRNYGNDDQKQASSKPKRKNSSISHAFHKLYECQTGQQKKIGEILGDAVRDSINTLLVVGGFIILFSVIIHILQSIGFISMLSILVTPFLSLLGIPAELFPSLVSGFFEITTGTSMASQATVSTLQKLAVVSAVISWGGLSVHAQALSFLSKTGIRAAPYFASKLIHAVLSYLISYGWVLLFYRGVKPVFLPSPSLSLHLWFHTLYASTGFFCGSFVVLLFIGFIAWLAEKIRMNQR